MAKLIELKCPHCKKPMEKMASACPECRATGAENKPLTKGQKLGCGCLSLFGLIAMASVFADSTPKRPTAKVSDNAKPSPAIAQAATDFGRKIVETGTQCDKAFEQFAKNMSQKSATPLDLYAAASATQITCENSWYEIGKIPVPDNLPAEAENKLSAAKQTCQTAYYIRKSGIETAMEVIDGDARPSKIQEFTESTQQAQSGLMSCVAKLMDGAIAAGVKPSDMKLTAGE